MGFPSTLNSSGKLPKTHRMHGEIVLGCLNVGLWYMETGDRAAHHSQGVLEPMENAQGSRNTPTKCLKEAHQLELWGVRFVTGPRARLNPGL